MKKSKLLLTITSDDLAEYFVDLYDKYKLPINILAQGIGTANSSILNYLGLEETKKQIIFSIMSDEVEGEILYRLEYEYELSKPGNGIAFTISLSSLTAYISNCSSLSKSKKENINMEDSNKYQLIMIVVAAEYTDQAMEAAKKAGATGGTLIHGRGLGTTEATEFLGITISPEKNIILILTHKEKRNIIMESVTKEVGLNTRGKGICMSIPVDNVAGLSKDLTQEQ